PCGAPPESYSTVHQYDVGHRKGAAANEAGRADQLAAVPFWMTTVTEEADSGETAPPPRGPATPLSRRRLTSPPRAFGRSRTSMTDLGVAIGPIALRTWPRSSATTSFPPSAALARRITNASMACPVVSSRAPTTAASATFGCATRADSISAVDIR